MVLRLPMRTWTQDQIQTAQSLIRATLMTPPRTTTTQTTLDTPTRRTRKLSSLRRKEEKVSVIFSFFFIVSSKTRSTHSWSPFSLSLSLSLSNFANLKLRLLPNPISLTTTQLNHSTQPLNSTTQLLTPTQALLYACVLQLEHKKHQQKVRVHVGLKEQNGTQPIYIDLSRLYSSLYIMPIIFEIFSFTDLNTFSFSFPSLFLLFFLFFFFFFYQATTGALEKRTSCLWSYARGSWTNCTHCNRCPAREHRHTIPKKKKAWWWERRWWEKEKIKKRRGRGRGEQWGG